MKRILPLVFWVLFPCFLMGLRAEGDAKHVLLLAGPKSHGYGHHECNADISVLENLLQRQSQVRFTTQLFLHGAWPDESELKSADAIVIVCDGDDKHVLNGNEAEFEALLAHNNDLGLFFVHYATVPLGRKEADFEGTRFKKWIGGYYAGDSRNKTLTRFTYIESKLTEHPVNRGVTSYRLYDEIYYRMELVDNITPVVIAEPAEGVPTFHSAMEEDRFNRDLGQVASFESERERTIFWSFDRMGGGRSLATTMGHIHRNFWTNESIRRQMVNSVGWVAGLDIPAAGFDALDLTEEQLMLNHSSPKSE
jgi:type 1 glutamine amidotransferase